jgi:hypothetical protein
MPASIACKMANDCRECVQAPTLSNSLHVQAIRERFHSLATDDSSNLSLSLQELAKCMAADISVRATLNTNRLGHRQLEPLTTLHFVTLLTILCLPTIMPPRRVQELFADISSGRKSQHDICEVLGPYLEPQRVHACETTSEEIGLVKLVLLGQMADAAAVADNQSASGQRISNLVVDTLMDEVAKDSGITTATKGMACGFDRFWSDHNAPCFLQRASRRVDCR